MAGTKEVIEVLHFVGAEQAYIAKQFQWHFLVLGLIGAVAGGFLAIIVFLSLGFWATKSVADPTADQMSALFGTFAVGPSGYIATVLLIFGIAGLTALTSRFTVLRHLNTLDGTSGWEK